MERIQLEYNDTKISVLHPGQVYKGSRFDWTGIVEQISIGSVSFLGQEAHGQYAGTEGIGLSSEFGMEKPLSYWKTFPGKDFMKIGVGALKRETLKSYDFFRDYPVRPFDTKVRISDSKAVFFQEGCRVGSYSYDYVKQIEASDREVIIDYHLINRGASVIRTEEYCHNFFRLGNKDLTSSVSVETAYPLRSRKTVGSIGKTDGRTLGFSDDPDDVFYMYGFLKDRPSDFTWKISDGKSGYSVKGIEDFPVSKFALWGMSHVISPETFHSFTLGRGADLKWRRRYLFEI